MATELELYLSSHDAIHDVDLSKTKSGQLLHQGTESRKVLEDQNMDSDYKRVLSIIFDKTDQIYEQHKRKRENVVRIDDKDDSGAENAKGSGGRGSDPEHLHPRRAVNLKNDRYVCVDKGESSRKSSGVIRPNIRHKRKHELQSTSVKKTNGNRADKVDNMKALVPNLEYRPHRNVEGKHKDSSDSDVEILDSAAIKEGGVVGPFVPSKKFHKSMQEDQVAIRPSTSDEFRKQALDVLSKPFDKEEYVKHQQAVKSYLDYHPDLRRKLTKYRYNQGKRLAIYRGFFFWLQNLTQEGSFKPWEDRECLAVEL